MSRFGKIIKIFTCFFIIGICVSFVFIPTKKEFARADEEEQFDVTLTYSTYTLPVTGRVVSYKIVYDGSFYSANKNLVENAFRIQSESFSQNGYTTETDLSEYSFTATLTFDSTEEYYLASGYDGFAVEKDDPDMKEKKSLFFIDYEYETDTAFIYLDDAQKFIGRIYKNCAKNIGIKRENVRLVYEYGTPYDEKMITSNADNIKYSSQYGIYLHTFVISTDDIGEKITIRQHVPNSAGWYGVAAVAGLIVFGIVFAILMSKKKKKRS